MLARYHNSGNLDSATNGSGGNLFRRTECEPRESKRFYKISRAQRVGCYIFRASVPILARLWEISLPQARSRRCSPVALRLVRCSIYKFFSTHSKKGRSVFSLYDTNVLECPIKTTSTCDKFSLSALRIIFFIMRINPRPFT